MSKPFTLAVPDVGFRMVQSMLIVVVLPAPFGPSKPKISPDSTLMSSLSTALSPLNDFVSWLVSITLVNGLLHFQQLATKADLSIFLLHLRIWRWCGKKSKYPFHRDSLRQMNQCKSQSPKQTQTISSCFARWVRSPYSAQRCLKAPS